MEKMTLIEKSSAFAAELAESIRRGSGRGLTDMERDIATMAHNTGYRAALIDVMEATHNLANVRQIQELIKELRK